MTETVWLCTAPQRTTLIKRFEVLIPESSITRMNWMMEHSGGGQLDLTMLPKRAVEQLGHKVTRLPSLFSLNGFFGVSEKLAAVLRQFDLGGGGFYPLEILRHDGVTPVPGTYWALNFGAKKDALKPDECQNIEPFPQTASGQKRYSPWLILKDDDFAVNSAALEGPDLWGDEHLATAFFVSARLHAALVKARLDKPFDMYRCRIV